MGLDFMSGLHHRVRHSLEDGGVAAGMHGGQGNALQERELLHSKGLVEILSLDVLTYIVVGNRGAFVISGTKVHPGCVVVLVIDDVHLIVTVVLYVVLFLLEVTTLQNDDLLISFLDHLVFHLGYFRFFQVGVESPAAGILLEKEVLLPFIEVLAHKILVFRGLPLPTFADVDKVVACAFELIGREFSGLLEHVFLGRRTPFFADLLCQVVGDVLAPVPPAHYDNIMSTCIELSYKQPFKSTLTDESLQLTLNLYQKNCLDIFQRRGIGSLLFNFYSKKCFDQKKCVGISKKILFL